MRLLNVHSFKFEVFYSAVPQYAILSHRWATGSDVEASIRDIQTSSNTGTLGYRKVRGFRDYVAKTMPDVDYIWVDTCCINQDSSAEVTEAINSMFKWYRNAKICVAYLADVSDSKDLSKFRHSLWFTRGWTLQELLAPATVVFVTRAWTVFGRKGGRDPETGSTHLELGPSLNDTIAAITGIPEGVLWDYNYSRAISAKQKLDWMADRVTTREEDQAYCLLGLFDVTMPVIYGEGQERARKRLSAEIADAGIILSDMSVDLSEAEMPPRSLHEAASQGKIDYIAEFLETTPSAMGQLWKWDAGGSLPLHRAVQARHPLACRLLIVSMNRQAWDPTDLLDASGKTPIMYALADTSKGAEDVLREFLTDQALCFSIPTIVTGRRSTVTRVMDIGGPNVIQRALAIMSKLLPSSEFGDVLGQALPTMASLPHSETIIPRFAAEAARLQKAKPELLSGVLAKIADTLYQWATSERVRRLVLLQKAAGLTTFTGSEGINFVGMAIVSDNLDMLDALHAIDSAMLSKSVGWWTGNWRTSPNQARFGPWKPLRFGTLLGQLETVRHLAQLIESEDYDPPHIRAVHLAVMETSEGNSKLKEIWQLLRDSADDESAQSDFQLVTIEVEFAVDWGMILFPYRHEATIMAVETVMPDRFFSWDGGYLRVDHKGYDTRTCATCLLSVKMRSVASEHPKAQSSLVHVDFMHGYNDFHGNHALGSVNVLPPTEDRLGHAVCFREMKQHHFTRLEGTTKLASGVCMKENHHNLRSWQMQCVRN